MTSQFSSEENLFNDEDEQHIVRKTPGNNKRNSFGPRLPLKILSPKSGDRRMSDTKGKGAESGNPAPAPVTPPRGNGGYTGTQLGFGNMAISKADPLLLEGKGADGTQASVNLFSSVFVNGMAPGQLETVLNYLHAKGKLDFSTFIEGIVYQGFDRAFYIRAALKKVSVSVFCKFAILGAVRGSNFAKIVQSCTDMPQELITLVNNSVVIKTAKKRDDLTILRFTASIPHWVAFWLFSVDMDKKIESEDCPGWLQFPGAASLPMGKKQRLQHISFCKAFSALLPNGSFNGNIYYTAFSNPIPVKDIPSIIKDGLGISDSDSSSGTIASSEVQDLVTKAIVKTK